MTNSSNTKILKLSLLLIFANALESAVRHIIYGKRKIKVSVLDTGYILGSLGGRLSSYIQLVRVLVDRISNTSAQYIEHAAAVASTNGNIVLTLI